MSGLAGQLLLGAVGGLVAALVTSGLSVYAVKLNLKHARKSDQLADARRLRDARSGRIRTAIETVLNASLVVGQVVQDSEAIFQSDAADARDARHDAMLKESSIGLNEARVSLMLYSVTKDLVKVVDEDILLPFTRYRSTYVFNRQHPDREAHRELEQEYKALQVGIEKLRIEGVRVLDEMERPI
jgi:hypothetical protein